MSEKIRNSLRQTSFTQCMSHSHCDRPSTFGTGVMISRQLDINRRTDGHLANFLSSLSLIVAQMLIRALEASCIIVGPVIRGSPSDGLVVPMIR